MSPSRSRETSGPGKDLTDQELGLAKANWLMSGYCKCATSHAIAVETCAQTSISYCPTVRSCLDTAAAEGGNRSLVGRHAIREAVRPMRSRTAYLMSPRAAFAPI